MRCTSCTRKVRAGSGRRALVVNGKAAAMGLVCASCARTGLLLVLGDPDVGAKAPRPRLGFQLSEAPGVRGAIAKHLRNGGDT